MWYFKEASVLHIHITSFYLCLCTKSGFYVINSINTSIQAGGGLIDKVLTIIGYKLYLIHVYIVSCRVLPCTYMGNFFE